MRKYINRFIDKELNELIGSSKMIVIDGAKGCGKTEAAKRIAQSFITIDTTQETKIALENDPNIVLDGKKPRLIDEWQLNTWIWNKVRHAIDDNLGCYILTGSSTPTSDETRHSGAGRVIRFKMRPMSWQELGYSTGEVKLEDVLKDKIKTTKMSKIEIDDRLSKLSYGGWPFLLGETKNVKKRTLKEYVESLYTDSLLRIDGVLRDSKIGMNLLMSFSRNIGTSVPLETILKDMKIHDTDITRQTLSSYYNALERIHIIEDLPAWSTHIRSSTQLRITSKRYFVDPSLAIACLGLSIEKLRRDPNYCGFLFENEVVKNLRIYGEQMDAKLYYFGESTSTTKDGKRIIENREVDIIMEFKDGSWAAFEVKYGFNEDSINSGVKALKNLVNRIDFTKVLRPMSLNIVTCDGFAYKRKEDGINVIPLNVLGIK